MDVTKNLQLVANKNDRRGEWHECMGAWGFMHFKDQMSMLRPSQNFFQYQSNQLNYLNIARNYIDLESPRLAASSLCLFVKQS